MHDKCIHTSQMQQKARVHAKRHMRARPHCTRARAKSHTANRAHQHTQQHTATCSTQQHWCFLFTLQKWPHWSFSESINPLQLVPWRQPHNRIGNEGPELFLDQSVAPHGTRNKCCTGRICALLLILAHAFTRLIRGKSGVES